MDEDVYTDGIGRMSGGKFVLSEVMMDEQLLIGYELSDVLNITPSDIEQIEYFLPTNHEMLGNLAGHPSLQATTHSIQWKFTR